MLNKHNHGEVEKQILLWTVIAAITIMIFCSGCGLQKNISITKLPHVYADEPLKLVFPEVTNIYRIAVTLPIPSLHLLQGYEYPQSGEGGVTNTYITYYATSTQCMVDNHCASSTNLCRFLSCSITVINTNNFPWYGPTYAEHPEWFSKPSSNCHPHDHLEDYFLGELEDYETGVTVATTGDKGFCPRSLKRFIGTNAPIPSYCESNAIAGGYGDTYDAMTPCNGMDITTVQINRYYKYRLTLDPKIRYGFNQYVESLLLLTATNVIRIDLPVLLIKKTNDSVIVSWANGPGGVGGSNWNLQSSKDMQTWVTQEQFANSNEREFPINFTQQFFRLKLTQ